jgi:hypothetical protein
MEGAAVPEAAIDEYRNSAASEDYVSTAWQVFFWTDVHPISKTTGVQQAPNC